MAAAAARAPPLRSRAARPLHLNLNLFQAPARPVRLCALSRLRLSPLSRNGVLALTGQLKSRAGRGEGVGANRSGKGGARAHTRLSRNSRAPLLASSTHYKPTLQFILAARPAMAGMRAQQCCPTAWPGAEFMPSRANLLGCRPPARLQHTCERRLAPPISRESAATKPAALAGGKIALRLLAASRGCGCDCGRGRHRRRRRRRMWLVTKQKRRN